MSNLLKEKRKIKILHTPRVIGGNPYGLAKAERELGLDSWNISLRRGTVQYKTDEMLCSEKDSLLIYEFRKIKLLIESFYKYDLIHFNFGTTIMSPPLPPEKLREDNVNKFLHWIYFYYTSTFQSLSLFVYKLLDIPVFVTYQGDDARQGDSCKKHFEINPATEVSPGYYAESSDKTKRKRIKLFDKYATKIYTLNPDLKAVLPARTEFLPYTHVDLDKWVPVYNTEHRKLRIIHAPSHREFKGTGYVMKAIEELQKRHFDFEFELIENIPYQEVKKHYEEADLLIDQVLAGWYGGLAVELMALGKPVVCYLREEDLQYIPAGMKEDMPIINATPDTLVDTLAYWLGQPRQKLVELGKRSRAYVEKWHNPIKTAKKLKQDYEAVLHNKQR